MLPTAAWCFKAVHVSWTAQSLQETCHTQEPVYVRDTTSMLHTAKVTQSELRHNVELACTPIYSGSAAPNEHRVAIHCATRGSVIPGAGMGQKGAGHHNQQAGCRPPTQGRQVVPLHVS